jgi:histidinol-phosphate aminotransferase
MNSPLAPLGISQGVAHAALAGPEELARGAHVRDVIRLGSNESPLPPSERVLAVIRAEAQRAHRYGDPSNADLRAAIAALDGVDPHCVSVGAGIDDLLGSAVRAYLAPGAPAIATRGTFPTFEMHVHGFGGALHTVPYRADARVDLDGLAHAAHKAGGGLVFVANPDNPSGSAHAWGAIVTLLDALPDGSLLVHDEAYANFLPPAQRFPRDAIDPRMLRMRTFSKEYGLAGLRVGYALGAPEAIAALEAVRLLYGVNRIAQAAALAALADTEHVERVLAATQRGRAAYARLGERLGIRTLPSTTNFVLFDFGSVAAASAIVRGLLELGIHVRKPPAPPLDGTVRISVGSDADLARLSAALEALAAEPAEAPTPDP